MILKTERLLLRPQVPSDAPALFTILGDPEAMRFWSHPAVGRLAVVKDMIAEQQTAMAEGFCHYWTVMEGDEAIGSVDLSLIHEGSAELGFLIRRDRWGLGLASEAAGAAAAYGLSSLGLRHLVAVAQLDNLTAKRVLEKTSFRQVERRTVLLPGGEQRFCAFYQREG